MMNRRLRRIPDPLKLSQLSEHVEVGNEKTNDIYMVAELVDEIMNGQAINADNWFVIKRRVWEPSANVMIESYIETEQDDMYENWGQKARDCFTQEIIEKIQEALNLAFRGDYATAYWTYEQPVEIDIFPGKDEEK
ncbi:hypothetical protein [Bacillus pumilus]|uniref:hypothetical protein n=1 Tax=Bacillus pumilus TaxID=1408 RepID=UPI0021B49F05|nr:hypothetical protein [Bacillus pumilus]